MDLPKVPDSKDNRWETLDIFLFSNGEQHSPPRKYCLKSEELSEWDSAMKTLAQSQYGNLHSKIDLYTVNGQKVTSPIEVINSNAYVAVLPNEAFIPGGYSEYLLKACRSREKRAIKTRKSIINQQPGINKKEEIKQNLEDMNKNNNPRISMDTEKNPQAQTTSKSNTLSRPIGIKSMNNTPMNRKKLSNVSQVVLTKTTFKSNESISRKNFKSLPSRISNREPVTLINNISKFKTKVIPNTSKDNRPRPNIGQKGESITHHDNELENEKNISTDKELIVVKNPDSIVSSNDYSGLAITKQTLNPPMPPIDENNGVELKQEETKLTIIQNYVESGAANDNIPFSQKEEVDEIKETNIFDNPLSKNECIMKNHRKSENIMAYIDRGDILNLSLKIEVKKGDDNNVNIAYPKPLSDKNLSNKANENTVQHTQKSTDILNMEPCDQIYSKFPFSQCSCYNHLDFNDLFQNVSGVLNSDERKYVIILPHPDSTKLNCTQGTDVFPLDDSKIKQVPSTECLLSTNTYADTSLLPVINDTKLSRRDTIDDPTSTRHLENTLEPKGIAVHSDRAMQNTEDIDRTDSISKMKNSSNTTKQFVDDSTQTEWDSLILEARLHDDGRYSFHLPPLHVLQTYFL